MDEGFRALLYAITGHAYDDEKKIYLQSALRKEIKYPGALYFAK